MGCFRAEADTDTSEQKNSDMQYVSRYYVITAKSGYQMLDKDMQWRQDILHF